MRKLFQLKQDISSGQMLLGKASLLSQNNLNWDLKLGLMVKLFISKLFNFDNFLQMQQNRIICAIRIENSLEFKFVNQIRLDRPINIWRSLKRDSP